MATITFTGTQIAPTTSTTVVYYSYPVYAGETLSAGDWVYKKSSDGYYYKADNTTAEKSTIYGMAANGSTAGQRFNLIIKDTALTVGTTTGLAQGRIYGLSATAGKMASIEDIATTADIYLTTVAQCVSGTVIKFDFSTPAAGIQND